MLFTYTVSEQSSAAANIYLVSATNHGLQTSGQEFARNLKSFQRATMASTSPKTYQHYIENFIRQFYINCCKN